jgi:hypothetical protein
MRFFWPSALVVLGWFAAPARAEAPAAPAEPATTPAEAAPSAPVPAPAPGKRPWVRPGTPQGPAVVELPVAAGVSSPTGWPYGTFGASLYVGIGRHVAVRGNLAWYESNESFLEGVASAASGGEVPSYSGSLRDAGVAGIWYPRRLWSGPMLEAGVLQRVRDTGYQAEFEDGIKTKSTTWAGRAMVGWSWLIGRHVFVAIAMGVSAGRETGEETIIPEDFTKMPSTRPIQRMQIDGEAYLRIGVALGR